MIWVVGFKGMLGSEIYTLLQSHNMSVLGTDIEVDISNKTVLQEFVKNKQIEYIINCAAYTDVEGAEIEEDKAFLINKEGPKNLAEISKGLGATLIHFSTDFVFSGKGEVEYTEDSLTDPLNIYGKSKLAGDLEVQASCSMYFIFRISWLFGKYGRNFVYTILNLASKKSEISVVDDQTGSPTFAKDLAEVIYHIITSGSTSYGLYHYSNREKTDWFEYANTIFQQSLQLRLLPRYLFAYTKINPITTSEYKCLAKRPSNSYLCTDKFTSTFQKEIRSWHIALYEFLVHLNTLKERKS